MVMINIGLIQQNLATMAQIPGMNPLMIFPSLALALPQVG
jgi:hypothetical protein